ncbi:hypothetical protein P691DRAFT_779899 [Macrolepiota fuliginosa MF-IS2]|uniref:Uncharacterized protein n=1 Tax=Macrolepiota fuliginosa MF-IS2 TaxID=1400762 RepID=A0A9P6BV28_9AGAR|nr:hypothetical protein P691DRAFT_779899 [Macrolepiota fuliginosa MF-IS2]
MQKTQRFSVAVDKRMSTISTVWKSVTTAGANAGIRNSMTVSANRMSPISFGGIRPASGFALDDGASNQAGVGANPSDGDGALSPRQTHGPLALTPEDIRARIAAGSQARSASNVSTPSAATTQQKDEINNVLPALGMMRTDQGEDHLLPAPALAHTHLAPPSSIPSPPPTMMSPVMATIPPPTASVMLPNEMLSGGVPVP